MASKIAKITVVVQRKIAYCVVFLRRSINNGRGFVREAGQIYSILFRIQLFDMSGRDLPNRERGKMMSMTALEHAE